MDTFSGFPEAGLKFLGKLAKNNNREWFEAHKDHYVQYLREPALAFIVTLGERLKSISKDIIYDLSISGSGSLMRINRDTRFSPDKTPYKDHIDMMFWEGVGKKTENPGFGIRITARQVGMMAGMIAFDKAMLEMYRAAVVDKKLGKELDDALTAVRVKGDYTLGGEHYKTVPRGYDRDHPRADLLRYAGLHVFTPTISPQVAATPELVDVCYEYCVNMAPLQRWLVKVRKRG